ncbi:ABC transporter substrate-binding protein [Streptomyces sp. WAC05374]|uniref:ABC transporter substrate-binding protein n=1 Tax=Streptomyces sp. WAC05374 TaxID=2487420 RepID=UPI000F85FAB7|nr:ABC transporter substrate-binding protein [Streptomyces sp. WAC05374]RST18124.1 ABC transporter substrate-binding protein [Streptomyces sp. WAC05374]TDF45425.1 ABC transporter substrate-binding protein [Streptomyces sp. WAC05374]TDF55587.1 ABC transporter substrate-binding protein [Streptomyces sp. WAC05374]TDF58725.1 ABC transporter substrate-binding protein [Streptomyces sp. WAC05374]
MKRRTAAAALASAAAIALLTSACTGSAPSGAHDDPDAEVTLTFWHGWSAPNEVKAVDAAIERFEDAHPNITVKAVPNITDDKIQQALRAGGSGAPDVVSSFTTDNVGKFCSSGAFADLQPFIAKSGIDLEKTFAKPRLDYTRFEDRRCALPLLGDAYGLYYNKDAFRRAGIAAPPKTWSEFDEAALKLTEPKGDSYQQLGFMPVFHGYESTPGHLVAQWSPTYFDEKGRSAVAEDPAFAAMFTWQKNLIGKLGGFEKLERYRGTFGDEWGAKHPFHTGQVAMQLDGEWRLGMTTDAKVPFEVGVAPLPVPDDQAADYGKGYLSGTIIGIASTSPRQNAAWELVRYLTTDTDAVVNFANELRNVPATHDALASPKLRLDPRFKTFLDIARHPKSNTTPASVNGGAYQVTLQEFGYLHEAGKVDDLRAGLERTAAQIDTDIEKAK